MIDDKSSGDGTPIDKPRQQRLHSVAGGSGAGKGGRSIRVKTGDGDDEIFQRIMQALRKIERETGRVPTVIELSAETGLTLHRVRQILREYLTDDTIEGSNEFRSSLRRMLFDVGDLLVENGLISPEQWTQVQREKEKTGEPISLILSRLGLASENQVKNALELQYGVNYLPLSKVETPAPECLQLLPESLMRQHQLVPVVKDGTRVTIAMVNPNNLVALDDLKMRLKGMQVKLSVCTEDDFQSFMETIYSKHLKSKNSEDDREAEKFIEASVDLSQMDTLADLDESFSEHELERKASDAPIIQLTNQILAKAIKNRISDIHVEPQEKAIAIRFRRDGLLQLDRKLPKEVLPALVSRLKIMADLDLAERRLPQSGRIRVRLSERDIDFRVSTLPAQFGEKVVIHIIDKSNTSISLSKLISDPDVMNTILEMISRPSGIVFVTGPTGSGRTTTLYSALAERNSPEVNIVTAEDLVEYSISGITQVQVNREKGLDFARILRALESQDPDIILVGETRDKSTAKLSIEAALDGRLVFTTLRSIDAPEAISYLEGLEIEPFLLSSATIGIVAQRLLRRVCSECKEEYLPERNLLEYLGLVGNDQEVIPDATVQFYRFSLNSKGWPIFYRGKGCDHCHRSGYRGRVGCYEVMKMNDELKDLVSKRATTALLRSAARAAGMVTLKEYSLRLVAQGLTTPDECIRVTVLDTGNAEAFRQSP